MKKKIISIIIAIFIPIAGFVLYEGNFGNYPNYDGKVVTASHGLFMNSTFEERVDASVLIVRGNIVGANVTTEPTSSGRWDNAFTYWEIEPITMLKGESDGNILYKRLGGETESHVTLVEGLDFAVGDEVIFYMDINHQGDYYPVAGIYTTWQLSNGIAKSYVAEETEYTDVLIERIKTIVANSTG